MKFVLLAASLAAIAVSVPTQAFTFFSLGGAPDPGLASFEKSLITFDAPAHAGITQTNTGSVGVFTGTSYLAAAPARDRTKYLAISAGGSATFDFSTLFTGKHVRSLSVYIGSVDLYNHIDILSGATTLGTINGIDLPGNDGDQGKAITNRRLYINFAMAEGVTGLRFWSDGIAFEFDNIAASGAIFGETPAEGTPTALPPVINGSGSFVPEPAAWSLMIAGFALVGTASRRRRTDVVAA